MMEKFSGIKYKLESSHNFDNYLKEIGVNRLVRMAFLKLRPTFQFFVSGEEHKLIFETHLSHVEMKFKLDDTFEYILPNKKKVLVTVHQKSEDTLFEVHQHSNNKTSTVERKFYIDRALMTFVIGKVTATRLYLAQND